MPLLLTAFFGYVEPNTEVVLVSLQICPPHLRREIPVGFLAKPSQGMGSEAQLELRRCFGCG